MSQIFTPGRIGSIEAPNRLVNSATFECMAAPDGSVTEDLIKRYRLLARGEIGLIINGYMFVHPRGKCFPGQTGAHDDGMIPGMAQLVRAVHDEGGRMVLQIAHGGRQSPKKVTGQRPLAPSPFGRDPASMDRPVAATEEDIALVIDAFAQAARRVRAAGADGVQLHCAHGYLISEFLSPFFNRRQDRWGGTPEKMFRLLKEIILAIQAQVGAGFPILIKLNTVDHTPAPGITPELAAQYAAWLKGLNVGAVEISSGTYYTFHTARGGVPIDDLARALPFWMRPIARIMFKKQIPLCRFLPLYNRPAAEIVKSRLDPVPLILVGGVRRIEEMEQVLAAGQADFLSMSRPFIREPFLAKRLREGRARESSCISCNKCFAAIFNGLPVRCYVNGLPRR